MEQLGMGEVFKKISNNPRGLVAVTGPTGSGKSTTLAAMIDYINSTTPPSTNTSSPLRTRSNSCTNPRSR